MIKLQSALNKIKKTYSGKDEEGNHILDKSKLSDDLSFDFSMHRVAIAIKTGELSEEEFIGSISEGHFVKEQYNLEEELEKNAIMNGEVSQ